MQPKLISLLGMAVFVALAWALSLDRKRFPWRTVASGMVLQLAFALIILKTTPGAAVFRAAQAGFAKLIACSMEGARLVFGPLADEQLLAGTWGAENTFLFAVTVTATIIVISSLSTLLYHYGVLQRVVRAIAWVMERVMRTSGSESLSAAANIFMGQTEAPLVVKPYLERMTPSEILAVM